MEEHAIQYRQSYESYRAELNHELNRAAEGFVRIGYLLKVARDTDILAQSKYSTYTEFAQGEFGLDKSQVSRFIQINDRFSEGGNSDRLLEKYRGFGSAKLTLMLALPEEINEALTPEYTKAEIQTIKEEVEAEQKITPIEVMVEDRPKDTEELSLLAKVLYQIGETEPELMSDMIEEEYLTPNPSDHRVMELLAPAGQKMYMVRIPGIGKFALNINGDTGSLLNIRDNSKETLTAEDVGNAIGDICSMDGPYADWDAKTGKEVWSRIYKMPFPKEKVAPAQPKKEAKVTVAKPEKQETAKPVPEVPKTVPEVPKTVPKVPKTVPKVPEKEEKGTAKEEPQETAQEQPEQDGEYTMEDQEADRYEYMEPDETIEALEELLEDYEKAMEKAGKEEGKEPIYVSVDMDEGYARGIYNAVKELQYMKKLGGSRR
ncbi:MAG: hypothetical protein IJ600_03405 [Lachnospiraceae bacterium]|nr:hypothetical protein [Lachnospiraceae bacterium]